MIPAPGQGFRTGLDIQFIAIPYPIPAHFIAPLAAASGRIASTKIDIERGVGHVSEYKAACDDLDALEATIREQAGVVHTRPEFLTNFGAKK